MSNKIPRRMRGVSVLCRVTFASVISLMSAVAMAQDFSAEASSSSEYHPMDQQWYTTPWPESEIPNKLSAHEAYTITQQGTTDSNVIWVDPSIKYQTIRGIGASLEHTTVYTIQKNKTIAQQRDVLRELIDPSTGIGMSMFRLAIGTSDFGDGRMAIPVPQDPDGWYSLHEEGEDFSIERDRSLGIIDTVKLAISVAAESNSELKFVGSAWSPPAWMRTGNDMVSGGPLMADMVDDYAAYLRNFVEAYQAEGIPIYALTMQNEHYFTPSSYPGMSITWEMERDILIEVYENFHNIGGDFGPELDVKLWTNDHNFDQWQKHDLQIESLKALGKEHYLDATAFHHYAGTPDQMTDLHDAHPAKSLVFTEGSLWGVDGDGNRRSFETLVRHFRNWSEAYISWVTMANQDLSEANQSPYNSLGAFDPTILIQPTDSSKAYYHTPEFYMQGQFTKYIRPGAVRIDTNYGSLDTVTNVAFLNQDGRVAMVVVNQTSDTQPLAIMTEGNQITATVPPRSVSTFRWLTGEGFSPHEYLAPPLPVQDPFLGEAVSIPGLIEAENYDLGGSRVAYSDSGTGNNGGAYRTDSVDIEVSAEGGFNVGWVNADEWLEYSVNTTEAQAYTATFRVASGSSGGTLHLEIDLGEGVQPLLSTVNIPATLDWQDYVDVRSEAFNLPAGDAIIRVVFDGGEFNFTSMNMRLASDLDPIDPTDPADPADPTDPTDPTDSDQVPYLGAPSQIPGRIEAEDYDIGNTDPAYMDTDEGNNGNAYREDDVDVEASNESGFNIGWTQTGEYLEYTVNVAEAGTYTLNVRVASNESGSLHIEMNGSDVSGSLSVPSTGGWQNWETLSVPAVYLESGEQILRVSVDEGGFNLNWLELITDDGEVPVVGAAIWFQNFEAGSGFSADSGASVSLVDDSAHADGSQAISYTANSTGNPESGKSAIILATSGSVDASEHDYLIFSIKDLQGNNTHYVRVVDANGSSWSGWVDISSSFDEWIKIDLPLSWVSGVDLSELSEVHVGEWNNGSYLLDDFYFADSVDEAIEITTP
ncbi:MAG: O-glycosyl hydrolase [Flavobacteriales bacterium]|jgi:O-glycosyl hydrolase